MGEAGQQQASLFLGATADGQDAYPGRRGGRESGRALGASLTTRAIKWDLIAQQYDQMVKYATALRLGTTEAEAQSRTRSVGIRPSVDTRRSDREPAGGQCRQLASTINVGERSGRVDSDDAHWLLPHIDG